MIFSRKEKDLGCSSEITSPTGRHLLNFRMPKIGRGRILAAFGLGLLLTGCTGTPATPTATIEKTLPSSTLLNPYGITVKADCRPDNLFNLELIVNEDQLHLVTPDDIWHGNDLWTMIKDIGTGEEALVGAHSGRVFGIWTAKFPGRVGSIRPGGGYSERGFELNSGDKYTVYFFNNQYTERQPELNNQVAKVDFSIDCK